MKMTTRQDVFAAIDTLVDAGTKPTLRAILAHLGRGSMATVSKYAREWHKQAEAARGKLGQSLGADDILEVRVAKEMAREAKARSDAFEERALLAEARINSEMTLMQEALARSERQMRTLAYVLQDMQALALRRGAFGTSRQKDNLDALWVEAVRRARDEDRAAASRGHGNIKPAALLAAERSLSLAHTIINSEEH